mgnify:CR=1 FL=1
MSYFNDDFSVADISIISEVSGGYTVDGTITEDQIVDFAQHIAAKRLSRGEKISNPDASKKYVQNLIGSIEHEVFYAVWLDSKHRVIVSEILFRGTIDSASVPVREVVKDALKHNAAAVIFSHNHPSGVSDPSLADKSLTKALYRALNMVGVKMLDHIVVTASESFSFAEFGEIS